MSNLETPRQLVATAFRAAEKAEKDRVVAPNTLEIQGGNFPAEQLEQFLLAWQPVIEEKLIWQMVEEVSQFYVERRGDIMGISAELIERIRCFGTAGDLDVRRDGATCYWRFIGDSDGGWPDFTEWNGQSFWNTHPTTTLTQVKHNYYQWRRGDDRTSLDMTILFDGLQNSSFEKEPGIKLQQTHYLNTGNLEFVRFTNMQEAQK